MLATLLAGVVASGASCPQPAPGAKLTARTQRFQTLVTLTVEGSGYTPGQTVNITIQNVPGAASDFVNTRTPDAAGKFQLQQDFALKQVPAGTELAAVTIVGRDSAGWFLIAETSANPFVIFF